MKKEMSVKKKSIIKVFVALCCVCCLCVCCVLGLSEYVVNRYKRNILTPSAASELKGVDCIIVLGCGVHGSTPSLMLSDRLEVAIELYKNGVSDKILMSGDHGTQYYDEVNTMKQYAINAGVDSHDIFMDHAGFSTYDTAVRAAGIFQVKKAVIVTQEYHLYRAVYNANRAGIEAYGVHSSLHPNAAYNSPIWRTIREILARDKDFFMSLFHLRPVVGGEEIPIRGDGDITNDKPFQLP